MPDDDTTPRSGNLIGLGDPAPVRTTSRLELEPLRLEHADEVSGLLDDDRLHTFVGGAPLTRDGLRRRYQQLVTGHSPDGTEDWLNWVLRRRDDRVAVGWVQATVSGGPTARRAALAWTVGVAFQGRGFAREGAAAAMQELVSHGVGQFTANIHPAHGASIKVARALGLTPTGRWADGEAVWETDLTGVRAP